MGESLTESIFGTKAAFNQTLSAHCVENFKKRNLEINNLHNARIAIVGAQGFVGSWLTFTLSLLRETQNLDFEITAIGRRMNKDLKSFEALNFQTVDLSKDIVDFRPYTHIFHLANGHEKKLESNSDFEETISMKVMREIMKTSNIGVRLLLASSGAVYGEGDSPLRGFKEEQADATNRNYGAFHLSSYGDLKMRLENALAQGNKIGQIRGVAARLFSFYGPNLPRTLNFAIGNFVEDIVNNRKMTLQSNGKSIRTYQHGLDLSTDLISLISSDFTGIVNVGGSESMSLIDVIHRLSAISHLPINVLGKPVLERLYTPNLDLLNSILPSRVQLDLEYGLRNWIEVAKDTHNNSIT